MHLQEEVHFYALVKTTLRIPLPLDTGRCTIFPLHSLRGDNPLLAVFADIYAVDKLSVGNRLAQRAFIQSPNLWRQ